MGIQVFDMMFRNNSVGNNTRNRTHIYQEYESTIYALTAAIDAKDHYTFSHSNNVAYYATSLATTLGMNEDMIEIIRQAALLHDVGKIGIPMMSDPSKWFFYLRMIYNLWFKQGLSMWWVLPV